MCSIINQTFSTEERWHDCAYVSGNISQQEGYLCAQHCLNALLQGPYFNAVDLASFGHQMDEEERIRMAESGVDSEDYKLFLEVNVRQQVTSEAFSPATYVFWVVFTNKRIAIRNIVYVIERTLLNFFSTWTFKCLILPLPSPQEPNKYVTIANCFLRVFSNHRETWTTVDTFQFKLLAVLWKFGV